jgi:outer membrane protein assembly factor BamB
MFGFPNSLPRIVAAMLVAAATALSVPAESPGWPQFLGPARNGVSPETGLIQRWPEGGPNVLWRARGGVGMSAVAVSDGRAVTTWNSSAGQVVVALDAIDGTILWKTPLASNYKNGQGDGPRATPTIAGDNVFAYSGEGILACLRLKDGKQIWSKNLVAELRARAAEYGMACSPLVIGKRVVVTVGGSGTAVVAVDGESGEIQWAAGDGAPGYSSPALLNVAGEFQLVAFTGRGAIGLRPENGTRLWEYPFPTPFDCNTATPISVNGNVFISAGENHGCVMLQIQKDGDDYRASVVWESVDVKSIMRNEWQTSALIDGHLYGFDNVGSAGPTTHLTCINASNGDVVWRQNRFGKGNLVAADGHLWITTMKGELVLAKASPDGYAELGRQTIIGKTRQTASIAGARAYLRDDKEIVCVDIGDQR